MLPTQTAPHCGCGQVATGLPLAPSLSPSISLSFKPATSTLPQYCSHFPSRTFKHILVTSCYTLFPSLPFHFFHQSFFSSPTSLLWGVLFTSRCPQSRATVLGEALHPVWRWEPSQGEQMWNQSSSKPPLSFTSSLQNPQSSVGRGARLCLPDKHIPRNGDI